MWEASQKDVMSALKYTDSPENRRKTTIQLHDLMIFWGYAVWPKINHVTENFPADESNMRAYSPDREPQKLH
jgi:hypothetical protein